jgi:hypothetical protein
MGRFLFVVPPVAERIRPTVVVGRELAARGHDVAWTGHRDLPDDVPVSGVGSMRSPTELMLLWNELLLPLARTMLPVVRAEVDDFRPDVVVADQQALAGAAVAHLAGLPWATTVPTSAGLADPLWDLPKVKQRIRRRTRCFLREAGLDDLAAARIDPQASPHLTIAFTAQALAGSRCDWSGRRGLVFVGPGLCPHLDLGLDLALARDRPDPCRPLVVVALETPHAYGAAQLRRAATDALSSMAVRTAIVEHPDVVTPALARHAAAVVCDGGHSTVCAALADAVPLVVVPLTGDQPLVADQVARAAAGVHVPARSADPARLRRAVATALTDERIRHGVHHARDSLATAPGPPAAADRLEALLAVKGSAASPPGDRPRSPLDASTGEDAGRDRLRAGRRRGWFGS